MLLDAAQVALLVDPVSFTRCNSCGSLKNCRATCTTQSNQGRNLYFLFERLIQLRNSRRKTEKQVIQEPGAHKHEKKRFVWATIENSCTRAKQSQPNIGLVQWSRELQEKEDTSQVEDDVIHLINTFNNPLLGWVLSSVSDVEYWALRPSKYFMILLYIMKTSQSTNSGPSRLDMAVQAWHGVTPDGATMPASQHQDSGTVIEAADSPSNDLEQHTEEVQAFCPHISSSLPTHSLGMAQPSNPQIACEGQAVQRVGANAHLKRRNDEGTHEEKRIRLRLERQNTDRADEIPVVSKIPAFGQKPYPSTSPKQYASVKTSALLEPCYQFHRLTWNSQKEWDGYLSPAFEYRGQSDGLGTDDCILEYFWPGFSVAALIANREYVLEEDDIVYYYKMSPAAIEKVPFQDLVNSIKRSETWKRQLQDCKGSECFIIQLAKCGLSELGVAGLDAPPLAVATVKCIVPKEDAPRKRQSVSTAGMDYETI